MANDIGTVAGGSLIFIVCVWAVWFGIARLRMQIQSGMAVDRTLSEVHKEDAPGVFWLQVVGFVLFIGMAAMIGIGALVTFIQYVWAAWI